ncbi:MAG: type II toxin-antitoxin system HicA family toxin [Candidatus Hinthialibacter sp.]
MKLPRDVHPDKLIKCLRKFGYIPTRQKGSHMRITTNINGVHHEVIPYHNPLKVGTLLSILKSVATHHSLSVDELLDELDL